MNSEDQRTSCPGFLDEYGIWNNGFECPSISNQIRVCCGSDSGRYCCTLEHFYTSSLNPPETKFLTINQTNLSFLKKINLTFLTLPFQLILMLFLILLLLLILLIIFLCYRYYKQQNHNTFEQEHISTKQTLLIDHFPFTPPHHQLFYKENNNQPIKDTLTTSTSSSSAVPPVVRLPSEIYFNDWKEFFQPTEHSINNYPTMSSHNYNIDNYSKYQQDDIIV